MLIRTGVSALILAALPLCFGQSSDDARAKLWGSWKADGNASSSEAWELRDADGTLHMMRTESDRKNEVECNVMGRECKIKLLDGKPATVSFYFNGPKLVEWEKAGDKVVRRRFTAVDGDTLEVETTSIVPSGKPETTHLKRVADSAAIATNKK